MLPNISTNKQETRERKGIVRSSSSSSGTGAGAGASASASASASTSAGAGTIAVIQELAFKNRTV
jgi:hypothetical protein